MNFMTEREILKGLKYRITNLKEAKKSFEKKESLKMLTVEYEGRVEELERVYHWIKSNQGE